MMKYQVTVCRRVDFYFCQYSNLLWPRLVNFGIPQSFLGETKSRDIFSNGYGYRAFVNQKWLPLNLSLIKVTRKRLYSAT